MSIHSTDCSGDGRWAATALWNDCQLLQLGSHIAGNNGNAVLDESGELVPVCFRKVPSLLLPRAAL